VVLTQNLITSYIPIHVKKERQRLICVQDWGSTSRRLCRLLTWWRPAGQMDVA